MTANENRRGNSTILTEPEDFECQNLLITVMEISVHCSCLRGFLLSFDENPNFENEPWGIRYFLAVLVFPFQNVTSTYGISSFHETAIDLQSTSGSSLVGSTMLCVIKLVNHANKNKIVDDTHLQMNLKTNLFMVLYPTDQVKKRQRWISNGS